MAYLAVLAVVVSFAMQPSMTPSRDRSMLRRSHEPNGLFRSDGKRPDGTTMVPWSGGKVLVWDATCPDTVAPSYSSLATREAGMVAEEEKRQKKAKYSHLERLYCYIPVAVETFGVFSPEAHSLVNDLGRRIAHATLEPLSTHYFQQRISVAVRGEMLWLF